MALKQQKGLRGHHSRGVVTRRNLQRRPPRTWVSLTRGLSAPCTRRAAECPARRRSHQPGLGPRPRRPPCCRALDKILFPLSGRGGRQGPAQAGRRASITAVTGAASPHFSGTSVSVCTFATPHPVYAPPGELSAQDRAQAGLCPAGEAPAAAFEKRPLVGKKRSDLTGRLNLTRPVRVASRA